MGKAALKAIRREVSVDVAVAASYPRSFARYPIRASSSMVGARALPWA
jgi:hypothetical protein